MLEWNGYGIRLADPPPQPIDKSGVGMMVAYEDILVQLDKTHKITLNTHGFSIVKLDESVSTPEFAMFEMSARFAGMLPYRASFECPLVETDVNSPIPTSQLDCFAIMFS